jgi:hypothetical protein
VNDAFSEVLEPQSEAELRLAALRLRPPRLWHLLNIGEDGLLNVGEDGLLNVGEDGTDDILLYCMAGDAEWISLRTTA